MAVQFSVIIPTKDRPHFLVEALASVFAQDNAAFEVLVVNDGMALPELLPDSRLRVLQNGQQGAVPARNLGISEATGEFVAFLDDDDRWVDRNHLSRAAALFQSGADFIFADGSMQFPGEASARQFTRDATAMTLQHDNTILVSSVCYRKALHADLGAFDAALPYYWDWDWYLRVARAGYVLRHVRETVVDIRIHAQNMSGDAAREARQANLNGFSDKHGLGQLILKNHTDFV